MKNSRICALIPARYGSSRLMGKPLYKINGQSIIQKTYTQTTQSKYVDDVYVVTDDERIANHVREIGGKVIIVTDECLNGTERIVKALPYINEKYDIIVNVQGDEPFIDPNNIDFMIEKYLENESDQKMVCTTLHYNIHRIDEIINRGIGKMIMDKNNNVLYCSRAVIPHTKNGQINVDTKYYGHIGIFTFRRSFLKEYLESENTSAQLSEDIEWLKIIELGYSIKSFEVAEYEIGVNTEEDYNYLSKKYSHKMT